MASLQAALKSAIQVHFQLEDSELAAEPLPGFLDRRRLLFYEAAEGGAGVLRRLVEDPAALPAVVRVALELLHFDPETGNDLRRSPRAKEDCVAACYDCLLSYRNQPDHRMLDRHSVHQLLMQWTRSRVSTSPRPESRADVMERLMRLTDSALERRWLNEVDRLGLRLPSAAQERIASCNASADFFYADQGVVIFVDGPPHDGAARRQDDQAKQRALEDAGYFVLRFHHAADWPAIFRANASLFGELEAPPAARLELDLYDDAWHDILRELDALPDVEIVPGKDVARDGRVIGTTTFGLRRGGRELAVVSAGADARGLIDALAVEGLPAIALAPDQADAVQRLLAALGA
jgi:very-short-patch-repair endonuclease